MLIEKLHILVDRASCFPVSLTIQASTIYSWSIAGDHIKVHHTPRRPKVPETLQRLKSGHWWRRSAARALARAAGSVGQLGSTTAGVDDRHQQHRVPRWMGMVGEWRAGRTCVEKEGNHRTCWTSLEAFVT